MPFQIVRNDITKMNVDAIVNTANPMPGYGAGIDSAVYEAAGKEKLLAKRQEIGAIERGTSVITDGYDLSARYIIHTVGTAWKGGTEGEEQIIRSCYRSVFKLAAKYGISSLAIPLLASGSYGFPKGIALRIALSEIEAFMSENDMQVYLVVFDEKSVSLSSELYGDIDEYISDNYVEEKSQEEYQDSYDRAERPGLNSKVKRERADDLSSEAMPKSEAVSKSEAMSKSEAVFGRFATAANSVQGFFATNLTGKRKGSSNKSESVEACCEVEEARSQDDVEKERSLDDVINNLDKTFMELVFSFADAKGLTDVEVQKKANLDRKAFSKLKCGTTKNPSKATALALAIALELNLDDTKDLLSRAGLALSPCSKQDVIVKYFIEKEAYDIYEINVALFEHGEQLLGTQSA